LKDHIFFNLQDGKIFVNLICEIVKKDLPTPLNPQKKVIPEPDPNFNQNMKYRDSELQEFLGKYY